MLIPFTQKSSVIHENVFMEPDAHLISNVTMIKDEVAEGKNVILHTYIVEKSTIIGKGLTILDDV